MVPLLLVSLLLLTTPLHFGMEHFCGTLEYLMGWSYAGPDLIRCSNGMSFSTSALPFAVDADGQPREPSEYTLGAQVFASQRAAFDWLTFIVQRDLTYRGFRDERLSTWKLRMEACFLLHNRVLTMKDALEYEAYRQQWQHIKCGSYVAKASWSPEQQRVFDIVHQQLGISDEHEKDTAEYTCNDVPLPSADGGRQPVLDKYGQPICKQMRWLYVSGTPGSGKTEVLLHLACTWAKKVRVLIVCPTGQNVFLFKSRIPEELQDNVRVDTIHGVLGYKRTKDNNRSWTPPSILRKFDLVLMDEASQYDDREFARYIISSTEQPHKPFQVIVADFSQLQPLASGMVCRHYCESFPCSVEMKTVYRTSDPSHLLFLNRIRLQQPSRQELEEYFGDRHLQGDLHSAVAHGIHLSKLKGEPFMWLTDHNEVSGRVCAAVISQEFGISEQHCHLYGVESDPNSKSPIRRISRFHWVSYLSHFSCR